MSKLISPCDDSKHCASDASQPHTTIDNSHVISLRVETDSHAQFQFSLLGNVLLPVQQLLFPYATDTLAR